MSSTGMAYDPSPPQSEDHLTNMDYTNLHSYRTELDTHSKYGLLILRKMCFQLLCYVHTGLGNARLRDRSL